MNVCLGRQPLAGNVIKLRKITTDSLLLLKPKSNQKASAHLRWLFAQSSAHGQECLVVGNTFLKIIPFDGMILRKHSKANPIAQVIGILSIFPPLEMSRGLKDFLRKVKCL
ncbi:hypothetical protein [Sphingobacterium sp. NPDC055346]